MSLTWRETYSVGIEEIDQQHHKLFDIYNELYNALKLDTDKQSLTQRLDELFEYTIYHFKSEEELLKEYSYPDLEEHIKEHNYFRRHIREFQKMNRANILLINMRLTDFLKEWIFNHVLISDREYALHMKKI